jgi:hypothetical protein
VREMKTRMVLGTAAMILALVLAAGAVAASKPPAYRSSGPAVQKQVQSGVQGKTVKTVGALPFTGLDLTFAVGGGLLLLLAGGTLRRVSRRKA